MTKRPLTQRIEDSRKMLQVCSEVWLATASDGLPHLVPLSLAWDVEAGEVVVCTEAESRTVRNIGTGGARVRMAVGETMDVLMLEGEARVCGFVGENESTVELFKQRTGWDPRGTDGEWVFIRIGLDRAQAWRNVSEIDGRTIMRDGRWL